MPTRVHLGPRFRFSLAGLFILLTIAGMAAYCLRSLSYQVSLKKVTASQANDALSEAGFGYRIPDSASNVDLYARTTTGWESNFDAPEQQFLMWCKSNEWAVSEDVLSEAELSRFAPGYAAAASSPRDVWRFSNLAQHRKGGFTVVYDRHTGRARIQYTMR